MDTVGLTVPAEYAARFAKEARTTLQYTANNLREAMEKGENAAEDGEGQAEARLASEERASRRRLPNAEALLDQVERAGTDQLDLAADREVLLATVVGCMYPLGEEVHGAVENRWYPESPEELRELMAELTFWVDTAERLSETDAAQKEAPALAEAA
jgi:hypothetical protein